MSASRHRPFQHPHRHVSLPLGVLAAAVLGTGVVAPAHAGPSTQPSPQPSPPAAVDGTVMWIAVSPEYRRTGLVMASVSRPDCGHDCLDLWASHDGGSNWERSAAEGWGQGRFSITATADGHDVVFGEAPTGVQRSDDGGATWFTVGPPGTPSPSPDWGRDRTVAVASPRSVTSDYVLHDGLPASVAGSGGTWTDLAFMLAPSFPSGGRHAPVLLSAGDPRTQTPVVAQCDGALRCNRATTLAGAGPWAVPVTLIPSTTYGDDGTVFAKAGRAIFKSTTGGTTFVPVRVLPDRAQTVTAYPMLALAPGYSESGPVRTVYAAALQVDMDQSSRGPRNSGGIFRSTDGGATWVPLGSPGPLDGGASALAVAPDGRLFAGWVGGPQGRAGLVCSPDGSHWAASCPPVGAAADRAVKLAGSSTGATRSAPAPTCPTCSAGPSSSGTAGGSPADGRAGAAPQGAAFPAHASTARHSGQGAVPVALAIMAALAATALVGGAGRRAAARLPHPRRARRDDATATRCPQRPVQRVPRHDGRNVSDAHHVSPTTRTATVGDRHVRRAVRP